MRSSKVLALVQVMGFLNYFMFRVKCLCKGKALFKGVCVKLTHWKHSRIHYRWVIYIVDIKTFNSIIATQEWTDYKSFFD